MPIDLGLSRVIKLLKFLGNPHISSYKSVHIAGTNGKGSTIAYLSLILTQSRIRNGRFTSPHLVSYNDCISINDQTYPLSSFDKVREIVENQDANLNLGCTEFEILTATAFKIFEIEKVELALIEVGLGGRLDATNALAPWFGQPDSGGVVVCGITKIGMDHEGFLGNTIDAIAREKAGIIKQSVPVVVDHTNTREVLDSISVKAELEDAQVVSTKVPLDLDLANPIQYSPLLGAYQSQNLSVALHIVEVLKNRLGLENLTSQSILSGIRNTRWPGRLQKLRDEATGTEFLLDGAHNESAAVELGKYLSSIRKNGFIFVVAMSEGKSVENLLKHIAVEKEDAIVPFSFNSPDEMPWVKCQETGNIFEISQNFVKDVFEPNLKNVADLFRFISARRQLSDLRQIVICGSLYLCADILRHVRTS